MWLRVQAKLTDFGIGQVVSQEYLRGVEWRYLWQQSRSDELRPRRTSILRLEFGMAWR